MTEYLPRIVAATYDGERVVASVEPEPNTTSHRLIGSSRRLRATSYELTNREPLVVVPLSALPSAGELYNMAEQARANHLPRTGTILRTLADAVNAAQPDVAERLWQALSRPDRPAWTADVVRDALREVGLIKSEDGS